MPRFEPRTILELANSCDRPTGDATLDKLFDDYSAETTADDRPVYYRFLYRLAKRFPNLSLMELGCRYGAASLHFLRGGGACARAVDIVDRLRHDLFDRERRFAFLVCASTSQEAIRPGVPYIVAPPDLVLIDSDHSYHTTAREFEIWSQLVAPGGMILFDDVGAYESFKREDFACGRFFSELPGEKLNLPQLHPGGWGFGIWFAPAARGDQ